LSNERPVSPSAERNKGPILEVLERVLPKTGRVLEIASGTGQHAAHFARALRDIRWQPSDPDPEARRSIAAWLVQEKLPNLDAPLELDVRNLPWPVTKLDAVVCINMIHIAPWTAATSLFAGAKLALREEGVLYLYGPYRMHGAHTAATNEAFDRSLRAQNPQWGVRELDDVVRVADTEGFDLVDTVPMPANNFSMVFRKRDSAALSLRGTV
jgi:SAM-dependent methyltransferase